MVCKLCPLYNFNTIEDIFMKLCTNINQTELCPFANFAMEVVSAQELPNPLRYFHKIWYKYKALWGNEQRTGTIIPPAFFFWILFPWKSCPLNNFETLWDIFMELGRNISTVRGCAENNNHNSIYIFMELFHFENFSLEVVPAQKLWNPLRIFHETWYKYKAS